MGFLLSGFSVTQCFLGILCTLQMRDTLIAVDFSESYRFFSPSIFTCKFFCNHPKPMTLYYSMHFFHPVFHCSFPLCGGRYGRKGGCVCVPGVFGMSMVWCTGNKVQEAATLLVCGWGGVFTGVYSLWEWCGMWGIFSPAHWLQNVFNPRSWR